MNQWRENHITHDWIHEQDMDHVEQLARRRKTNAPGAEDYPAPESLCQAMFGGGAIDGTLWNTYQRASGSNPAESQSLTIWARMNSDWTIDFNIASGSQQEKAGTPVIHGLGFGTTGKPTGSHIRIHNRASFINSDGEEEQIVDYCSANWRVDLSFFPLRLRYYKLLNNRLVIGFPPTEYTPYETIGIGDWKLNQRERSNNYSSWLRGYEEEIRNESR